MIQNSFDLAKCNLCGICFAICPVRIIYKDEKTGYPFVAETNIPACIKCGHCEAVCPQNAVQINHEKLKQMPEPGASGTLTARQIKVYFMNRRSVRSYRQETVNRAVIGEMLDIVRYAPSGINRQPVQWIFIQEPKTVNQISNMVISWMRGEVERKSSFALQLNFTRLIKSWDKGNDPICRNAPHLAIAYIKKDDRMAANDATIALTHLELLAPAFGLGACWAGYFGIATSSITDVSQDLRNLIELPQDAAVSGALMLGVPKYKYARVPKRNIARVVWK